MTLLVLRFIAVALAIAGLVDPAFTRTGRGRARVAVVVQDGPSMDLPMPDGSSRRAIAERVGAKLADDLGSDYDLQPRLTSDAAAAIVIGDRYPGSFVASGPSTGSGPSRAPSRDGFSRTGADSGLPIGTVTVASDLAPNVRIVAVAAPEEVPVATAIRVGVEVEAIGLAGQSSRVTIQIAGLEVGGASHHWRDDRERWLAQIDAVPVGEPPFPLRVEVQALDAERTRLDNTADTLVDVRRQPFRVQVYEPRPSWATTFLRRALEADARFHVAGTSSTSRGVATRTADSVGLSDPALNSVDVVIVGGLERLTPSDSRTLDRFMRERGGAVALVPDARIDAGPALDLLSAAALTERLSDRPEKLTAMAPLAAIQASEVLILGGDSAGGAGAYERLAWTPGTGSASVVVVMPRGNGRLLFSGALDAWRFRAEDDGAFDRFWQSAVAGLALAAPPPIAVSVEPRILRPGERGEVVVRVRPYVTSGSPPLPKASARLAKARFAREGGSRTFAVRASIDGRPIRLWPESQAGVFRGTFTALETAGRATVVAQVDGAAPASASRPLLVIGDAQHPLPQATSPLSMLAASHDGIDVTPANVTALEQFIRSHVTPPTATRTRHPMRSGWWLVPFAACLSVEWWLRRRRGLR